MRPDAVDLTGCYQSVAVVNGAPTTVFIPKFDDVAEALRSTADDSLLDRWVTSTFKDLTAPDPDDSCWMWHGTVTGKGYGLIQATRSIVIYGFAVSAHVVAWTIENGTVPRWALIDGRLHRVVIDHLCCGLDSSCLGGNTCRHRRCSNPGHLELVTNGENVRRGKGRRGEKAEQVAAEARARQLRLTA